MKHERFNETICRKPRGSWSSASVYWKYIFFFFRHSETLKERQKYCLLEWVKEQNWLFYGMGEGGGNIIATPTWKLSDGTPLVTFSAGGPVITGDVTFNQYVSYFSTMVAL